ncbi:MAG: LemA family protein [Victivallis sp.]
MKALLITIGIIVAIVIISVIAAISIRNGLIERDEGVKAAWSQIDTQLQRRADLIPNLVNTVKGYAAHEEKIFTEIADARSRLLAAKGPAAKAEAGAMVESALGRLLAIAENYPTLKANENFIRLQDELAGTENRISVARTRYNDTAREFNASIRKFPGSLFASGLGLSLAEYFQPPEGSAAVQKPPAVQF